MKLIEESQSTRRETCTSATLSGTDPKQTGFESNQDTNAPLC